MPRNKKKKLVFIAGGIGVTPFRSMVRYLIDMQEKRTVSMIYANKTVRDIAYKDFFDSAARSSLGLNVVYTIDAGRGPIFPSSPDPLASPSAGGIAGNEDLRLITGPLAGFWKEGNN